MRHVGRITSIALTVLTVFAVAATSAWAGNGPGLLVGGFTGNMAGATEEVPLLSSNLGNFTLKGSPGNIVCSGVNTADTLTGLRLIHSTVHFLNCVVNGKTEAECAVRSKESPSPPWGLVLTLTHDWIVYTGSQTEAEAESGSLGVEFEPNEGKVFVTLEFSGTNCGAFVETKVEGSTVGQLSPVNGALQTEGTVNLPTTAIKKVYKWTGPGTVEEAKTGLKAFGSNPATESGLADEMRADGGTFAAMTSF
jgi:hypothetical protein